MHVQPDTHTQLLWLYSTPVCRKLWSVCGPLHALPPSPGAHPAVPSRLPLQVCASRTFNVLPIVEHCYDLGNLAAVCRSADGACFRAAQQAVPL